MSPLELARQKALLNSPEPMKAMGSESLSSVVNKAAFAWLLAALLSRYEAETRRLESAPILPAKARPAVPGSVPQVESTLTRMTGNSRSYFRVSPHEDEGSVDETGEEQW